MKKKEKHDESGKRGLLPDEKRRSDSDWAAGSIESRTALAPHIPNGCRVLEVGCGNGYLSELIIKEKNRLTAIDISREAIARCRKKFGNRAEFIKADILEFKPSKRFDFVFMNEVLDQIKEDQKALLATHFLLEKGGKLFLSTPISKGRFIQASVHHYSEPEIRQKVLEAGFEVEKIVRYGGALSYAAATLSRIFKFSKPFLSTVRKSRFYKNIMLSDAKSGIKGDRILIIAKKRMGLKSFFLHPKESDGQSNQIIQKQGQ